MADDGVRSALAFVTAAYSSYSGCRQYREDLAAAQAEVGKTAPRIDKIRHYFNSPGFVDPMIDNTVAAIESLARRRRRSSAGVHHALHPHDSGRDERPNGDAYVTQHREVARLVAEASRTVGRELGWDLVYQSRSGPPSQPWLEPDIADHLREERYKAGGRDGADRLRLRPHRGRLGPGYGGRRGRGRDRPTGRAPRRSALILDSSRWCASWSASASRSGPPQSAARWGRSGRAGTSARPAVALTREGPDPPRQEVVTWSIASGRTEGVTDTFTDLQSYVACLRSQLAPPDEPGWSLRSAPSIRAEEVRQRPVGGRPARRATRAAAHAVVPRRDPPRFPAERRPAVQASGRWRFGRQTRMRKSLPSGCYR